MSPEIGREAAREVGDAASFRMSLLRAPWGGARPQPFSMAPVLVSCCGYPGGLDEVCGSGERPRWLPCLEGSLFSVT